MSDTLTFTEYTALKRPNEVKQLIKSHGLRVSDNIKDLGKALNKIGYDGNVKEVFELHPDYAMLKEYWEAENNKNIDANNLLIEKNTTPKEKSNSTQNTTVVSKETMHTVLGIGLTLALIGTVVVIVKNMK